MCRNSCEPSPISISKWTIQSYNYSYLAIPISRPGHSFPTHVQLPPKFEFSFTAEKDRMTFAPAGLVPLAAQLGEVKAISEVLFAARITSSSLLKSSTGITGANGSSVIILVSPVTPFRTVGSKK